MATRLPLTTCKPRAKMMAFNKRCRFAKGARRQKSEGLPRLRARGPRRHLPPISNLEYVLKDLFHRPRRNPKSGETRLVRRCDRVDLHQVHLITREGCSW